MVYCHRTGRQTEQTDRQTDRQHWGIICWDATYRCLHLRYLNPYTSTYLIITHLPYSSRHWKGTITSQLRSQGLISRLPGSQWYFICSIIIQYYYHTGTVRGRACVGILWYLYLYMYLYRTYIYCRLADLQTGGSTISTWIYLSFPTNPGFLPIVPCQ